MKAARASPSAVPFETCSRRHLAHRPELSLHDDLLRCASLAHEPRWSPCCLVLKLSALTRASTSSAGDPWRRRRAVIRSLKSRGRCFQLVGDCGKKSEMTLRKTAPDPMPETLWTLSASRSGADAELSISAPRPPPAPRHDPGMTKSDTASPQIAEGHCA